MGEYFFKLNIMKNLIFTLCILCCPILLLSQQQIGICGYSSLSTPGDGLSFVLGSTFNNGNKIYITDADYSFGRGVSVGTDEVLEYTFHDTKNEGEVITITETYSNSFTIDCSGFACGSISIKIGSSWLVSSDEPITIFTDDNNDGDPSNSPSEILSFAATTSYFGSTPGGDAIVITGLAGTTEFNPANRSGSIDLYSTY
jgi:hypothetical protein